tara:strand:+ start:3634 stop:4611 length:978 start_codon:yes stop_codon:yes gene_type:complete
MKKVIVIGGAGYVGTHLVDELIKKNYKVTVYDLFIYGNLLNKHKNLSTIYGDIRDIDKLKKVIKNFDYLIHLACISNDPSFDLDPELGKSINLDPFEDIVKISKDNGVNKFLYASSSSVYGLKSEKDVNENFSLEPLTDYSKYKAMCEEILLKYNDKNFTTCIIRPATVCGFSRRQRFDVVVNILTNLAYNSGEVTIFGGSQLRPNINIRDMSNAYIFLLDKDPKLISGEIYNIGYENYSVNKLCNIVIDNVNKKVVKKFLKTNDSRSYHISSEKIKKDLGFKNKYNIEKAVVDLVSAFQNNVFEDPLKNENYFNIKKMKSINLK